MGKTIAEKNGLKLILVSNHGRPGYMIVDKSGSKNLLGYVYQGSEKSALRIFEKRASQVTQEAGCAPAGVGTTSANVGAFPVPIGQPSPGRKKKTYECIEDVILESQRVIITFCNE